MSTQTNTYAIIGAMLPYDALDGRDDELDPYFDSAFEGIHHHDGICILGDGMCGEYAIAGRVIAKSDENGHMAAPVSFPSLPISDAGQLKDKLEELFPDYPIELKALVLTHFR